VLEDDDEASKNLAEVGDNLDEEKLDVQALDNVEEGANDLEHNADDDVDELGDLNLGELDSGGDLAKGNDDGLAEVDNNVELNLDGRNLDVSGHVDNLNNGLVDDSGVRLDGDQKSTAGLNDVLGALDGGPLDIDGDNGLDFGHYIVKSLNLDLIIIEYLSIVEKRSRKRWKKESAESEDARETHFDVWGFGRGGE